MIVGKKEISNGDSALASIYSPPQATALWKHHNLILANAETTDYTRLHSLEDGEMVAGKGHGQDTSLLYSCLCNSR